MDSGEKKSRKRVYGRFECDIPNCRKVFKRADHLSRHKRNHDPSLRHVCPWPKCGQKFVRSDVKEKHYQRHLQKTEKVDGIEPQSEPETLDIDQAYIADSQTSATPPNPPAQLNVDVAASNKILSPSDLIEWLFNENTVSSDRISYSNHEFDHIPTGLSPVSELKNLFAVSPGFPHSTDRKRVDEPIRQKLIRLIPSLEFNPDFGILQIERCLEIYWLIYHPQYPILHRASFSNNDASPLLILAMIMLGACLTSCTGCDESTLFRSPQKLAEEIAEPLRWLIFSNPECKPPAKVYIIQSLLLLESFEITSTSRFLHERSFLYHGTKIQLLRRSPILGGDPSRKETNEDRPYIWDKWIEFESMKRACLMSFYLDTVNATVYGHTLILYAYQIKLSLPCDELLWEFDNEQTALNKLNNLQTTKFLDGLKKLLHRQKVHTSAFGKKILLAGLLTIMFQMQQKEIQLSFLEWNSVKESWKETMSLAIDVWRTYMFPNGCCDTQSSLFFRNEDLEKLPPMLRLSDTRCKLSLYHIAQIYMRITHYDYIIYAGAPSRMNVIVEQNEYKLVEQRIYQWASSGAGRISAIHSYLILCEMLLSPENEDLSYSYNPNADPFLHRKNIIASAVLVLFAYNFSLEGPESNIFNQLNVKYYPENEDGYSYLKRIRRELSRGPGGNFHPRDHSSSCSIYHESIKLHAEHLLKIKNKNNMVGLLKIFHNSFRDCNWQVGKEYSMLFRNCIERCLGSERITCEDMYLV